MKKLLLVLGALLIATSALAIVEPDDNMMGFYFDIDADTYEVFQVPSFTNVTMYLTLVNPTFSDLFGFEVGYTMAGTGMVLSTDFTNPNVIDVGQPGNHIVGYGEPTEMQPANILATLTVFYMDPDGCTPLEFFMHGTDPSSIDPAFPTVLLAGGELMMVGVSGAGGATSTIHGNCTVSTTETTFDGLKSLFR